MTLDEAMRHRLHGRLVEVLGAAEAAGLMGALPAAEHATKADLDVLEGRLRAEMAELRGEMAELRGELRGELRSGLAEQRAWFADELRTAITTQTRQVMFGLVGVVATFGGLLLASAHIH